MRKCGDVILSGLLACFVGCAYFFIEVVWKTAQSRPEGISWTMLLLALLVGLVLERMGAELPWDCPLWAQAVFSGLAVTAAEFLAGCVVNLWLGWGVWDYSHLPGNLLGQVCPQFAALWCLVCGPVIVGLDWMRYAVRGGERPCYQWRRNRRRERRRPGRPAKARGGHGGGKNRPPRRSKGTGAGG